jgi:hypothetical protein
VGPSAETDATTKESMTAIEFRSSSQTFGDDKANPSNKPTEYNNLIKHNTQGRVVAAKAVILNRCAARFCQACRET